MNATMTKPATARMTVRYQKFDSKSEFRRALTEIARLTDDEQGNNGLTTCDMGNNTDNRTVETAGPSPAADAYSEAMSEAGFAIMSVRPWQSALKKAA